MGKNRQGRGAQKVSVMKKVAADLKQQHYAGVVKLADTLDLGSNAQACRFKSCHPYQQGFVINLEALCVYKSFVISKSNKIYRKDTTSRNID